MSTKPTAAEVARRMDLLRRICEEVIKLTSSPLYPDRVRNKAFPVIGEGSHFAKIVFIGEAPGRTEAATGRPFVGAAGKILDKLLQGAGIAREDVYITNIVKDRPPQNRDPLPEEIAAYGGFLDRQIDIIKPDVIATLGRFSMAYIMEKFGLTSELKPISAIHGASFKAAASYGTIRIVPLYHPAVAVYNSHMIGTLEDDFKVLSRLAK